MDDGRTLFFRVERALNGYVSEIGTNSMRTRPETLVGVKRAKFREAMIAEFSRLLDQRLFELEGEE